MEPDVLTRRQAGSRRQISFWRQKIDRVNLKLLALLNTRAAAACRIGRAKKILGLPVSDPKREKHILQTLAGKTAGPMDAAAIRAIFSTIIRETKRLEKKAAR